jgi:anti-sigma B factor antagonist
MIFLSMLAGPRAHQLHPPGALAGPRRLPPLTATMTHGVMLVVLRGDLDLASAPELASGCAQVLRQRPRRMVIDLAEVGYLDCASARLIAGLGRALPAGELPVLRQPSPAVLRMLVITGQDASCEVSR